VCGVYCPHPTGKLIELGLNTPLGVRLGPGLPDHQASGGQTHLQNPLPEHGIPQGCVLSPLLYSKTKELIVDFWTGQVSASTVARTERTEFSLCRPSGL